MHLVAGWIPVSSSKIRSNLFYMELYFSLIFLILILPILSYFYLFSLFFNSCWTKINLQDILLNFCIIMQHIGWPIWYTLQYTFYNIVLSAMAASWLIWHGIQIIFSSSYVSHIDWKQWTGLQAWTYVQEKPCSESTVLLHRSIPNRNKKLILIFLTRASKTKKKSRVVSVDSNG